MSGEAMNPSRRDVLRFGAFGRGTLLLPRAAFPRPAKPMPIRTSSC